MMHQHYPAPALAPRVIEYENWGRLVVVAAGATVQALRLDGCQSGVSISIGIVDAQPNTLTRSGVAHIKWSAGSGQQISKVDIGRGTVVSVHGSYVEVWVESTAASGDTTFVVAAFPGVRPSLPTTRTTTAATALAVGDTSTITVPAYAQALVIERTAFASTAFRVRVMDGSSTVLYEREVQTTQVCEPIILSETASQVAIRNSSAAATLTAVALWSIRT